MNVVYIKLRNCFAGRLLDTLLYGYGLPYYFSLCVDLDPCDGNGKCKILRKMERKMTLFFRQKFNYVYFFAFYVCIMNI